MKQDIERWEKPILNYLGVLLSGKFADAERTLERYERKAQTPHEKRLVHALRGIFHAYQSDDRDSLIFKIFLEGDDKARARELAELLKNHAAVFDEEDPYFWVWQVILKNRERLPTPHKLRGDERSVEHVVEENPAGEPDKNV